MGTALTPLLLPSSGRTKGVSSPNEATKKLLDVEAGSVLLKFKDAGLEREYQ
ncbi:hypothetical protein HDU76_003069, partial [Blyttiomyces sp. JEL0837]